MSKISKHFHLTLHFTVAGDDSKIPTTGVNFKRNPNNTRSGDDEVWRESDDRQRRLDRAVINNKKVLHSFLVSCISSWLETETEQHWDEILFDEGLLDEHDQVPTENILRPAIAALSKEDRKIFNRQIASSVLYENIDEFIDCFSTSLTGVELVEVEMRQEP